MMLHLHASFKPTSEHFLIIFLLLLLLSDAECCSVQLPMSTRAPNIVTYNQGDSFFFKLSRGFKKESPRAPGGL